MSKRSRLYSLLPVLMLVLYSPPALQAVVTAAETPSAQSSAKQPTPSGLFLLAQFNPCPNGNCIR
jgi:hypothetical protein